MRNTPASPSRSWTIAELAQELEISTRTIRFYEEKGLISPERTSGNRRIYSKRDRARLKLILRGKRFGYSLEEIGEMIGMGAVDLDEEEQIVRSLAYGDKKLGDIRQRIDELKMLAEDIETMRAKLLAKLRELEPQGGNGSHEPGGDTGA
ncbi:MAG: MerR family DNA-binding transcriptional regulator [Proteobacteria bacterium]|nr:MerR family DNA-binding transcriptional regulator [Pseudomonadota bacterium]MBU4383377.1 MerR family DNA-binding transcriptional regulator [Pseudomonadota bacterium]MBU4606203.1 MerR family DNA-binding transcriptional regulator [Pseudomonadota bacterium]